MTTPELTILMAVIASCSFFLFLGIRETKWVADISDYLPLKKYLNSGTYRSTTVAAGMSLATVMVALLNLAPIMGIGLFVTVATYIFGLTLLYWFIPKIMKANPQNKSIPGFLESTYTSKFVGNTATLFSLLGYLSIFAMELLVGVTVVKFFFGDYVLWFAGLYFCFLVFYTWLSGYRGIVATDKWQFRFIILSVVALVVFFAYTAVSNQTALEAKTLDWSLFSNWKITTGFLLGIAAMNIPAPISDTATWQRLCSTTDSKTARKGLTSAAIITFLLWSTLIIVGILFSIYGAALGTFDASTSTVIDYVVSSMGSMSPLATIVVMFVFFLGLFSAMISTADSLLIAATHVISNENVTNRDGGKNLLNSARNKMLAISVISFAIFIGFNLIGFNVVQLVFAIYGAQLALFPATALALLQKPTAERTTAKLVGLSIAAGFICAWSLAIYGQIHGKWELQFYAPVGALVASCIVMAMAILRAKIWNAEN